MSVCTSRFDESLAQRLIHLTEAGLPLVEDPWTWLAEQLGISVESTLDLLKRLQGEGAIRRIAAVPNHYRLGYRHNGMTVWDVCDEQMPRLGELIGAQPFVSHCYRRPRRGIGPTTCSPWCMAAVVKKSTVTVNTCVSCWAMPAGRTRCW